MVKNGKGVKHHVKKFRKNFSNGPPWFIRSSFHPKSSWGFIPKNLKGSIALLLLIGINIFGVNYFRATENLLDSWLKIGVVFFLSIFIFVEIAKHKTEGVKPSV